MSVFSDGVASATTSILGTAWDLREGTVVPSTDTIALKNGGVWIKATYLYADLANSSKAAQALKPEVTGKIMRSYLDAATRIIRRYGGEIRSFDGDRVMGIFIGDAKSTRALKAGLGINWAVHEVLRPKFAEKWTDLKDHWSLGHGVGIDTGRSLVVRGGVRDNNDLISIGAAPNVAAKLSALRTKPVFATRRAFDDAESSAKTSSKGEAMWTTHAAQVVGGVEHSVVSSSWWMRP